MDVVIRWTQREDERDARHRITHRAWQAAYGHIYTPAEIEAFFAGRLAQTASWTANRVAPLGTLVAARGHDGSLVGLASLAALRGDEGELGALYVLPDDQGAGVGRALWDASLAALRERGLAAMQVWVLDRASQAIRFYEARGCALFASGTYGVGGHVEPVRGYRIGL